MANALGLVAVDALHPLVSHNSAVSLALVQPHASGPRRQLKPGIWTVQPATSLSLSALCNALPFMSMWCPVAWMPMAPLWACLVRVARPALMCAVHRGAV
uniref:Uncharacterized protein n=1 Tax=Eutreptiella gymnastica TaxID=73025 RepID=A0A7S4GGE9_9EUGL